MASEAHISVTGLHKGFGGQKVLEGIDLEVRRGETVAILGRSGTGKSVFLKLLVGLQTPDAGTVSVLGHEVSVRDTKSLTEIRKKIGFLFQQAALYDSLTVEQNVAFPLARHTTLAESDRGRRARELLATVGMERDLEKMPSQISGGMRKRVGIARALALEPEILLFDEPTAGLDPITATEIGRLIFDLKTKKTMTGVMVTHDVRGAKLIADRLVMLDEGTIRAEGTFSDLQKSKDPLVSRFLGEAS